MPKKPKMVVCPRCHRTIQAEDFRQHLAGHRGKKRRAITASLKIVRPKPEDKYSKFQEFTMLPEMKKAFEIKQANKPIKSNFSESQILAKFEVSLKDVQASYSSLKVEETKEPTVVEVWIDEKRNLVLKYNQLAMRTLTEKVIDSLLLHEACHVITLPDTLVRVPEMDNEDMVRFMGNSITNYDEYLANVEFVRRFKKDPRYEGLLEQQISLLTNFETIAKTFTVLEKMVLETGKSPNPFWMLEQLGAIVYDAMFFFIANDASFENWCRDHSLTELGIFVSWIYEDFERIRSLNLPIKESHRKVLASANLSMSVNPLALFFNKIVFADTTKSLHEKWTQKGVEVDLVQLWERRRQSYT
jgi:hypothetical protein